MGSSTSNNDSPTLAEEYKVSIQYEQTKMQTGLSLQELGHIRTQRDILEQQARENLQEALHQYLVIQRLKVDRIYFAQTRDNWASDIYPFVKEQKEKLDAAAQQLRKALQEDQENQESH